jgi:uncharacterized repeat protein (TIGR02543 family)
MKIKLRLTCGQNKLIKKVFLPFVTCSLLFVILLTGCPKETEPELGPEPEQKSITITFNTAGGSAVPSLSIYEGRSIPAAYFDFGNKVPKKTGFLFTEWKDEAGTVINPKDKFDKDTTLTAQWIEPQNITITFDTVGGSTIAPLTTLKQGDFLPLDYFGKGSKVPTKAEHRLKGWKDGTTYIHNALPLMKNTTLTAQWVRQITVTFSPGQNEDGSNILLIGQPPPPVVIDNDSSLGDKYPSKDPNRGKGWTFSGWYNGATKYTNLSPRVVVKDTDPATFTLTAHWLAEVVPDNAQSPAIHPGNHFSEISGGVNRTTTVNTDFTAMGLFSNVSDGGTLSAKWYRATTEPTAETQKDGTGGTVILEQNATTNPSELDLPFTWRETTAGEYWYWVIVTNTNEKATVSKTATATTQNLLHVTVTTE